LNEKEPTMKWNERLRYKCQLEHDNFLQQVKEHLFAGDHLTFVMQHDLCSDGNTALAEALATDKQVQTHFHDGILWARLGPQPNVLGLFARWGQLLGVMPSQVKNLNSREAWRQALQMAIGTRRLLLIIEDAWTIEDALAFQVGGPQCIYLLTTHLSNREPVPV
jgi:hypothetical protein